MLTANLQKSMWDEAVFPEDKHESFLQIDSITLLWVCIARHVESNQNNNTFALKK